MQRPSLDEEDPAIDPDHLPPGEDLAQDPERRVIRRLAVGRHQDAVVDDEEIGVARRQVATGEADGAGQGELDDLERGPVAQAHRAQAPEVLAHRAVVGRGGVVLRHRHEPAPADEAGEVVDMAVGVVVGQPLADPEDLVDRQALADGGVEGRVVAALGPVGVVLDGLGREQEAVARDLDAAALELEGIGEAADAAALGDARRDLVVERGLELPAPAVELPVGEGDLAGAVVAHEDRPVVAAPDVVRRDIRQLDDRQVGLGRAQLALRLRAQRARGVDAHGLEAADGGGELRELGGDEVVVARPEGAVGRPGEPGGGLGLPFGGHAEAQRARRFHRFSRGDGG